MSFNASVLYGYVRSAASMCGHAGILLGTIMMIANGFMWFYNVQPKHQEDAYVVVDASKHQAYQLNRYVAGVSDIRTEPLAFSFTEVCGDFDQSYTASDIPESTQAVIQQASTQLRATADTVQKYQGYIDTQPVLNYIDQVQQTIQNHAHELQQSQYRRSTSMTLLRRLSQACRISAVHQRQDEVRSIQTDLAFASEYANLHPEWKNMVLQWLEGVYQPQFTPTEDSAYTLRQIAEFEHGTPSAYHDTNHKYQGLVQLEQWQQAQANVDNPHSYFVPISQLELE